MKGMERFWQGGRLSCQMYHLFYPLSFHLSSAPLLHHLGHWFCALPKFIAWRCTLRIQTSLMRSCRIITLGSKLREASDGTLPIVARSFQPMFVWAVFKSACFSQLKGDIMCLSAVCGLSVSVILVSVIVYWKVLFGMLSGVCVLKSVFRYMFCMVVGLLAANVVHVYPVRFFCFSHFLSTDTTEIFILVYLGFLGKREINLYTDAQDGYPVQYKSFKWELSL